MANQSFTIKPEEGAAFVVKPGDKIVLVTRRYSYGETEPPAHHSVETVLAIRNGKNPRIELVGCGKTIDSSGAASYGGGATIPYDAETEARHSAELTNYEEMCRVTSLIRRMNDQDWQRFCIVPETRQGLVHLLKLGTK